MEMGSMSTMQEVEERIVTALKYDACLAVNSMQRMPSKWTDEILEGLRLELIDMRQRLRSHIIGLFIRREELNPYKGDERVQHDNEFLERYYNRWGNPYVCEAYGHSVQEMGPEAYADAMINLYKISR